MVVSPVPFTRNTGLAIGCPITARMRPFPTSIVPPPGLPITGEILTSHTRSIDPRARPIRYTGGTVPDGIARLVRAKLDAFITI
jgi:mRNA interferase MazF